MTRTRRIGLDELTLRPGTYFNPETEILIVVDDSQEIAHEVFAGEEFDAGEWVLISEEGAVDERKRDELIERFQRDHQAGGGEFDEEDFDEDEDDDDGDEDGDDELEGIEELELDEE